MSKDMNPSNWEAEAKQAYELLAEKDTEIAQLNQKIELLHAKIRGMKKFREKLRRMVL